MDFVNFISEISWSFIIVSILFLVLTALLVSLALLYFHRLKDTNPKNLREFYAPLFTRSRYYQRMKAMPVEWLERLAKLSHSTPPAIRREMWERAIAAADAVLDENKK